MENKKEQPMMGVIGVCGVGPIVSNMPSTFSVSDRKEEPNLKSEYLGDTFSSPSIPYEIRRHPEYDEGKQFKCKGKHQYRQLDGVWICECGRKMND